jgi:hypothetical protein
MLSQFLNIGLSTSNTFPVDVHFETSLGQRKCAAVEGQYCQRSSQTIYVHVDFLEVQTPYLLSRLAGRYLFCVTKDSLVKNIDVYWFRSRTIHTPRGDESF